MNRPQVFRHLDAPSDSESDTDDDVEASSMPARPQVTISVQELEQLTRASLASRTTLTHPGMGCEVRLVAVEPPPGSPR